MPSCKMTSLFIINSYQTVKLKLEFFQLITYGDEGSKYFRTFVNPLSILVDHLSRSCSFESPHFHQRVDTAQEFNILLGILSDFRN